MYSSMVVLLPGTLVNISMDVCVSFRGRDLDFVFNLKKFLLGYLVLYDNCSVSPWYLC